MEMEGEDALVIAADCAAPASLLDQKPLYLLMAPGDGLCHTALAAPAAGAVSAPPIPPPREDGAPPAAGLFGATAPAPRPAGPPPPLGRRGGSWGGGRPAP